MTTPCPTTRREWLRRMGALGAAGPAMSALGLNLAAMGRASAATGGDYKALVCVFLQGGNDAFNTVLATDAASWTAYGAARGTPANGIALAAPGTPRSQAAGATLAERLGGVLPIAPAHAQGRSYALHPALAELADLFGQQRAAIVANVGPLVAPTRKAAVLDGSAALPPKRFSHNDQQAVWQSFSAEGATQGWGGRMADLLLDGNRQPMFSATSLAGNAVWLAGQQARAYQMAPAGAIRTGATNGRLFGSAVAQQKLLALARAPRNNHLLEREHVAVVGRSMDAEALLRSALPAAGAGPWGTPGLAAGQADPMLNYLDPETGLRLPNPLAAQLQGVARMIAARQTLGLSRQVFFVSLSGFDTHDDQTARQTRLLAQLSQGLAYFDRVLQQMGVDPNVTTFTASEFGRNLASNGDGCDHGWGGHHLVMGGAVRGGDLYGRFPTYGLSDGRMGFTSDDQLGGGALLPAIPVDAYAATLGRWLGLSDSQLLGILPHLGRFAPSARDLGFMA